VREGLSYDDIGQRVYPAETLGANGQQAKKAVMKIRGLIASVERNEWPPAGIAT
jgi:hypothetical protein